MAQTLSAVVSRRGADRLLKESSNIFLLQIYLAVYLKKYTHIQTSTYMHTHMHIHLFIFYFLGVLNQISRKVNLQKKSISINIYLSI